MATEEITSQEFLQKLEKFFHEICKKVHEASWQEEFITYEVVARYSVFRDLQITYSMEELKKFDLDLPTVRSFKVNSLVYMNNQGTKGSDENKFGDLGFLVRIKYKDGMKLEGVSFLEAKRGFINKKENSQDFFKSINFDQIKRIYNNAPYSFLLLYDYIPGGKCINQDDLRFNNPRFSVIPLNLMNQLLYKSRKLHRFSLSFSRQILFRFFRGYDLNFDSSLIKLAKGYQQSIEERFSSFTPPTYLITASVSYQEDDNEPNSFEVNRNVYSLIDINDHNS